MKTIDLYCGAGGWSTGAKQAGCDVVAAVDHWAIALRSHAYNHPGTQHLCEDLGKLDPARLPGCDLLLASPPCTGHTIARGIDKPHHEFQRNSALDVLRFVKALKPRFFIVENVPEFSRWSHYESWCVRLQKYGYGIRPYIFDASLFGVPQERVRMYMVGVKDKVAPKIQVPAVRVETASSFLQLDKGPWSPVAGHATKTLSRIERAQRQHGQNVLVPYYGSAVGGRPLSRPVGTITTLDRYALVIGNKMRMLNVSELKAAMSFPENYLLHGNRREQIKQLGNAVCPTVAAEIIRQLVSSK